MLLEENSARSFLIAMRREWPEDYLDIMWVMRDKAQGAPDKASEAWPVQLLRTNQPDDKIVVLTRGVTNGKKADAKARPEL